MQIWEGWAKVAGKSRLECPMQRSKGYLATSSRFLSFQHKTQIAYA